MAISRAAVFATLFLGLSQASLATPFRLVLESDIDAGAGNEVFAASFGSFDDFLNSPAGAPGAFSGINIASGFSVAGFAYDGMYRMLLESNNDASAGREVFAVSFATFDDFINSPAGAPGAFSGINIAPGFSVRGFAHEFQSPQDPPDDPQQVPEPGAISLMLAGLIGLGLTRRKRMPEVRSALV